MWLITVRRVVVIGGGCGGGGGGDGDGVAVTAHGGGCRCCCCIIYYCCLCDTGRCGGGDRLNWSQQHAGRIAFIGTGALGQMFTVRITVQEFLCAMLTIVCNIVHLQQMLYIETFPVEAAKRSEAINK